MVSKHKLGGGTAATAGAGGALSLSSPLQGTGHALKRSSSSNGNSMGGMLWRLPVVGILPPVDELILM